MRDATAHTGPPLRLAASLLVLAGSAVRADTVPTPDGLVLLSGHSNTPSTVTDAGALLPTPAPGVFVPGALSDTTFIYGVLVDAGAPRWSFDGGLPLSVAFAPSGFAYNVDPVDSFTAYALPLQFDGGASSWVSPYFNADPSAGTVFGEPRDTGGFAPGTFAMTTAFSWPGSTPLRLTGKALDDDVILAAAIDYDFGVAAPRVVETTLWLDVTGGAIPYFLTPVDLSVSGVVGPTEEHTLTLFVSNIGNVTTGVDFVIELHGLDAGLGDGGTSDGGADGGILDGGSPDSGADAGASDGGVLDGGVLDGGGSDDGGTSDGGAQGPLHLSLGCDCRSTDGAMPFALLALVALISSRRSR